MTTENNKTKLNLRPSIGSVGDKHQPPPTKLLINHGKPNYTINRSTVKKLNQQRLINNNNSNSTTSLSSSVSSVSSVSSASEPINDFSKITLKKPQPIKISPITTTTTTNKTYLSTVTLKKVSNGNTAENNEFLQKRKQIYDKINRENSLEENGYMNKIENGGLVTPTSPKDENYVKKISENLQNGTMMKSKTTTLPLKLSTTTVIQNGNVLESSKVDGVTQNGHHKNEETIIIEKPILPKKNFITNGGNHSTIVPSTPPPPPPPPSTVQLSNGITVTSSSSVSMTNNFPKIPSNPNGNANFEQRTIVSFSKDLASGPNKYPDVVKVVKPAAQSPTFESKNTSVEDMKKEVIQELSKLKFDIEVKDDVVIKPVIRNY